jgi:hypothetical protein
MASIKGKWGWPKKYANTPVATPPRDQWTTAGLTSKWSSQNTGNGIRTVYPKGSLTPSNTPLGGSSFYAEPRTFSRCFSTNRNLLFNNQLTCPTLTTSLSNTRSSFPTTLISFWAASFLVFTAAKLHAYVLLALLTRTLTHPIHSLVVPLLKIASRLV